MPVKVKASKKSIEKKVLSEKSTKSIKKAPKSQSLKNSKVSESSESSNDDINNYENVDYDFATFKRLFGDQEYGDVEAYIVKQDKEIHKIESKLTKGIE